MKRLTLLFAFLLTGCGMKETIPFYRSYTAYARPPKPKDYQVPIISVTPKRPHEVIGRLKFNAVKSAGYMREAIEWNAKRVGADAAILLQFEGERFMYSRYVPGYTTNRAVTSYNSASVFGNVGSTPFSGFGTGTSTSYVPVHHPGYVAPAIAVLRYVDALMIVWK